MKHPNPEMLLRIAQGDAYALPLEYIKRDNHLDLISDARSFKGYLRHPTYHKLLPGQFTDDTQMSIAVVETLLTNPDPTSHDFSNAFFACFKRDPRDGYSRALQTILETAQTADEFRTMLVPNSDKNGAAMRSVPLGIIKNIDNLIKVAGIQAQVTHATWSGINSSIAVALMSHYALYNRRGFANMYDWCCRRLNSFEFFSKPWEGPVHANNDKRNLGVGMITAHAVHTLLTTKTSLLDIMRQVIDWGGDTDSVAAIAWGIASARFKDELPAFFEDQLEPGGRYGASFLRNLGHRFMNAF